MNVSLQFGAYHQAKGCSDSHHARCHFASRISKSEEIVRMRSKKTARKHPIRSPFRMTSYAPLGSEISEKWRFKSSSCQAIFGPWNSSLVFPVRNPVGLPECRR